MLKAIISSICLVLLLQSCSTTTYIVRHAEKSTNPKEDPVLTEAGELRAEHLKQFLASKKLEEIYSTKTTRTLSTAKPSADLKGLEVRIYDAKDQTDWIENLKKASKNRLIVGHSNTIRFVINGLAQKQYLTKDLEDQEYDKIFIVIRRKTGKPRIKTIKY